MTQQPQGRDLSLKAIFLVFLKMGTFAFGGVYSMLAFFERELVERQKWLTHEEYAESVALGQMTPGAPIINTGICIGYKLRKLKGAMVSVLGQIFTGTALAVLLAVFYIKTKDHPLLRSIMKGVSAAVVGLLLSIIYKLSVKTLREYRSIIFALAAFLALAFFKLNPIGLIIASGLLGLIVFRENGS
jgi:chromate transporter